MTPRTAYRQRLIGSSLLLAGCLLPLALSLAGCKHEEANKEAKEAPPASPAVVQAGDTNIVKVDGADRFQLAAATTLQTTSKLDVTGSVSPDVSRELPVLSLANGRVVALHVGLGDMVHKGELVMEVQSPDVTTAFNAYLKAVNDEHLTKVTLDRDKLLYAKGAIPQTQLEAAQNGEDDALADLNATEQQLHILGVDKNKPGETVKVYAPASGVVIAQNVTAAGAAGINYAGNTGSLTIADLSHVWVIVDVYENDLATIHMGQHADIRINAYPGKVFAGTISDIGAILDPSIRTAKVRIQVNNPGNELRIGMFVTATITNGRPGFVTAVPASAVLHLHDLSYVFTPGTAAGTFRKVLVRTGPALAGNMIEIEAGIAVGQQVVANALDLQNTADQ